MSASRRRVVVAGIVAALAVPGTFATAKVAGLRRLGTPVQRVVSGAPVPAPLEPGAGVAGWTVTSDGRVTDVAVLPGRGLVLYVEELARRAWRATALDARTGRVRWRSARRHTGHIEAWAVTDAAVVLAWHHSASRLAWRTHRAVSFEGLDPVSGAVLWTRHVYNLFGERPGDHVPTLVSPSHNVVVARTEHGVPTAVDTRTGETRWAYPGRHGCRTHEIVAGPAGVAVTQRCPKGKERISLLDHHTGSVRWKTDISTPELRLLAVGTDSVAVYQGGLVKEVIILGPGGGHVSRLPCDCGDGRSLSAGTVGGATFGGRPIGHVGAGGVLLVGGPFGLLGADGATGAVRWHRPVPGGPVRRVLAGDGGAHIVGGDGALAGVDPATGSLRILVPGDAAPLDPAAIVVPAGGFLAAGSERGFGFTALG